MRRIRRRTRNRLIGVTSTLAVLMFGVFIVTAINKAGFDVDVHKTILGEAKNFGIVANEIHRTGHIDTNFATKDYYGGDGNNFTAGKYTGKNTTDETGVSIAAHVEDGKCWGNVNDDGKSLIWTEEELTIKNAQDKFKVQLKNNNTEIDRFDGGDVEHKDHPLLCDYVDGIMENAATQSNVFARKKTEGYVVDKEKRVLDVSKLEDTTVYVDSADLNGILIKSNDKDEYTLSKDGDKTLNIKKREDQVVVINFVRVADVAVPGEEPPQAGDPGTTSTPETTETSEPTETPETTETSEPTETPETTDVAAPDGDDGGDSDPETTDDASSEDGATTMVFSGLPTVAKAADIERSISNTVQGSYILERYKLVHVKDGVDVPVDIENYDDHKEAPRKAAEQIIFNMPYALDVTVQNKWLGTLVAPNASVGLSANVAGWLVCNNLKDTGGEWHFIAPTVPIPTITPKTTSPVKTNPVKTNPVTTNPVTTNPVTTNPVTTNPVTTNPVTTNPPASTTNPPASTTNPPAGTNPPGDVSTPAPTATPLVVLEEDVPKGPAEPEPTAEVPDEDVPLSNFSAPTKPKKNTKTIVEENVPLASTVPETGDTMNPLVVLLGMGVSLLALLGAVVIRKKNLI
ncbi:MAG: LPXTG cell wall anchor domain-containing protein [Eubacterium sp.]|nr:LPXTG cell wall anchor domain-containing protein [Eubacterium sp.]